MNTFGLRTILVIAAFALLPLASPANAQTSPEEWEEEAPPRQREVTDEEAGTGVEMERLRTRTDPDAIPDPDERVSDQAQVPAQAFEPTYDADDPRLLDGRQRVGAFLAGPGSLTFMLHHAVMGAAGGLVTQGISQRFDLGTSAREAMLLGTLLGAGLGFASSAWWQFTHWIDYPMANFGLVASAITGMTAVGLMDLATNDATTLAWTAFVGAELGAWVTALIAGGQMQPRHAWVVGSGGGWGIAYTALFMAILGTSGTPMTAGGVVDALMIGSGLGATVGILGAMRFDPSVNQVIRANLFGAGVGGAVLALSALLLGIATPTPYVLAALSSLGAMTVVSVFWVEEAERPRGVLYQSRRKEPYRNVWW